MRLSDAQHNLLSEIEDGSARYIRGQSRWWRTVEALEARGLITTRWEMNNQYECKVTEAGHAFLDHVREEPNQ